ncbi:MAG TPA: hypothetical protein VJ734_05410 [Nitrosospira sp.]|nr:hypothetical protein [Nitrosospira sp.]
MDKSEWYYQVGYVEILYAAMVVGLIVAFLFFRKLKPIPALASIIEEQGRLLGLLALAVVLFMLNRILGDLW